MKVSLALIFALLASATALPAQSREAFTTNELVSACRIYIQLTERTLPRIDSSDFTSAGICLGYMTGFAQAASVQVESRLCVPASVTTVQSIRVFLKYMDEHPEDLRLPTPRTLTAALANTFPCPK